MNEPYPIDFREPRTVNELASYIGIKPERFTEIIASESRAEFYQRHYIMKRSFHRILKPRLVWEAHRSLADAHKTIARRFDHFLRSIDAQYPHEAAYGYIRHRGTKDNAKIHSGAPLLLRADIQDFFPSISTKRLIAEFGKLGMHHETSDALAKFVTIDNKLPLGLNASPMLANFICLELDKKIQALAENYNCKYTRYADDISISGATQLPPRAALEKILQEEGFKLSAQKFRITKRGQAHYVTGLSISEKTPHIPRRMKRRLRQELYYCNKFGITNHLERIDQERLQSGINRLDGTVRYVGHIEERISGKLKNKWNNLLERDDLEPSYKSSYYGYVPLSERTHYVECYIDESEIVFGGRKFLALGLVFTEESNEIACTTAATLREYQVDPFSSGDKSALKKNGLHFTDSHPDLRTAYIKLLSIL